MRCPTKYLRGRISNYDNNNGGTNRRRKILAKRHKISITRGRSPGLSQERM